MRRVLPKRALTALAILGAVAGTLLAAAGPSTTTDAASQVPTVSAGRPIAAAVAPTEVFAPLPMAPLPNEPAVEPLMARIAAEVEMSHVWQSLNNCGPASVAMILTSLGASVSQETLRVPLRGEDVRRGMPTTNVDPWLNTNVGLRAIARPNGSPELVKALVTNGFAPAVVQWLDDGPRIAHWRVLRGYDDTQGVFYASDPMRGAHVPLGYKWVHDNWQPFAYRYMVIYRPADEPLLKAIMAQGWGEGLNRNAFYQRAKAEAQSEGTSGAWLNYGEAAYQYGAFEQAVSAFEKGMQLGSAAGVFTIRSSYPQALRGLGKFSEADKAAVSLANLSVVPLPQGFATSTAFEPDPLAVSLRIRRGLAFDALQPQP